MLVLKGLFEGPRKIILQKENINNLQGKNNLKRCFGWSIRKILVSVKFLSAILGPGMGASILWTPGILLSAGKSPCP